MTSTNVRKIQQLFDEEKQLWFDIYEAPGVEGHPITAEVPREISQAKAVCSYLLSKGATAASVEDTVALAAAIATSAPVVRRAARTGWRDDNRVFVSHCFVAPDEAEDSIIPPLCPLVDAADQLQVCGTLKGWQDLVTASRHSTSMTVGLCATFASPLLTLLHRPSFALVLFGPSKVGKSFIQLVAASAIGFGREKDLPTLNATPAGLQAAALGFNDHMLPINEVATARGKKRDIYEVLHETTYALLSGQETLRHPSWSGAGGASGSFGVIALFSSESSPDAWAARNGETRDHGEMARMIGLPVLASGCRTIFDRPPSKPSNDALAAWEKAQFYRLHRGLANQRGIAFREYLDVILSDVDQAKDRADRLAAHFDEHVATPGMSPVARDIVAKFGILYAGGVMAVVAKILPLDRKVVGSAVHRACLAALAELPDPNGELRADLGILREYLASGAIMNLETCTRQEERLIRNADGFRKVRELGKGEEIVVRAQDFARLLCSPVRVRRLLEWLDDEGLLDHSNQRTARRSNEWAQRHAQWPDGTRVRSIRLYLPNGLTDLEHLG